VGADAPFGYHLFVAGLTLAVEGVLRCRYFTFGLSSVAGSASLRILNVHVVTLCAGDLLLFHVIGMRKGHRIHLRSVELYGYRFLRIAGCEDSG